MAKTNTDLLGVTSSAYQKAAETCLRNFLKNFAPAGKNHRITVPSESETPLEIRVHENPPSVQIRQLPRGGVQAAQLRIREKISPKEPEEDFQETCGGKLLLPKIPIVLAEKTDLTRESIILTLGAETMEQMLRQEFIRPRQMKEALAEIRADHPDFFIVVQRFLIGIEHQDEVKVPYTVVEESNAAVFEYLRHIPSLLS